ncbi:MAG: NAD(P)-dependent oxidoreductase, partial [Candidatus Eremiobacteraeota bacterium]|nr:NAD(P)-dependent oxidoreductase [Candidatus Eremiobacteraeota bacterium]
MSATVAPATTRVAVVGVGRMGGNMARRLNDVGYRIAAVADIERARAEALAGELGAETPSTLAGVTEAADIVITVVTDDAAMRWIFARSGDSLLQRAAGRVFVNCATISPQVHRDVGRAARAAGAAAVEACMASSIPQARDG